MAKISTRVYKEEHGTAPKGEGLWAFFHNLDTEGAKDRPIVVAGPYRRAARIARAVAAEAGHRRLFLAT